MTRETDSPANAGAAGHHEGADRRHHVDRDRSDGGRGARWTFRAPVAVRPGDIASAIADAVARAKFDDGTFAWRHLDVLKSWTDADGVYHAIATAGAIVGPTERLRAGLRAYPSALPDLSTSPDMATPANLPSATDVPTTEPESGADVASADMHPSWQSHRHPGPV